MKRRLGGYIGLLCLILVLAGTAWVASDLTKAQGVRLAWERMHQSQEEDRVLAGALAQGLEKLDQEQEAKDPPFGDVHETLADGTVLARLDGNSRLNLNWTDRFLLQVPGIASYFPKGVEAFLRERERTGPSLDFTPWAELVPLKEPEKLFTLDGPVYVHAADSLLVQKQFESNGWQGTGAALFRILEQRRAERKAILGRDIIDTIGKDAADSGLFSVMAPLNLWSVDMAVVNALLALPAWRIEDVPSFLAKVESLRRGPPCKPGELPGRLGLAPDHVFFQYFGSRSQVFSITARKADRTATIVVLYLQDEHDGTSGGKTNRRILRRIYQ